MNKLDAAKIISGLTDFETEQSPAPTNVHIITGEVGSTSEDGKVMVSLDGLVFSDDNDQFVEFDTLGGLEEGDTATILLTGENGRAMVPLAIGGVGTVDRIVERVGELYADYAEIGELVADKASITDLNAATARIGDLEADHVSVDDLDAATARIGDLEADHVSVSDFQAEQANIDTLQANTADIATIRANSAKVQNLTAAQLEADHATIGTLDTTYMHANMSNSDVAWIENGTIKNGAIVSAMINDVSANKLTAGTINGSVINVTNLNADNITTGTINGQRIGEGSLSLSKLEDDVYTEAEVNSIVDGLNDRIDGAIETHTGTAVPTLNNSPASSWNTTKLRDEHVGDVYYVVNSQSQQNGYCYRFTKSGSTYSWQLIKDSDVTAALSRLTTAEGKITTFDSDISTLKTDTGTLTTRTTNLETRMSDAEDDILDKVDTTTFNEVSDTVDAHTQTISQHTTAIANKADSSTVTAVTNRVTKNEQDISGINTSIGQLQTTVESKADSSTVTTISNKLNTVSDTVDGHTQSITSLQSTVSQKADGSTVSTLSSKVNTVSDTVDGHTSQLTSITTTQTSMQSTLDKTVKSSIQLWYSKANTTAPSKPTAKVTSDSTSGNAWRIVVPEYNSSYPNYYYCWQYEYTDGTYGWSAVVRDIAMGESQATARTAASDASTAKTNAASAVSTANANIKSSVQLWFTKANSTAPNKPTSVVSTSNANTANAWNLVVPVWNKNYPHYFYCYQQQKGDGNYQWTDVVYDRATSEAQQLANTTSTNLTTLQEDYATYKQTTTENVSSIGSRLTTAEGKITTAESNITQNATNIALKVSKDGVISSINQSAESVKIQASKVEIDGTAVFNAIKSSTDAAYDAKGAAASLVSGGENLVGRFNLNVAYNCYYDYTTGTMTSTTTTNTADSGVYLQLYKGSSYVRMQTNGFGTADVGKVCGWTLEKASDFDVIKLKFNGNKVDSEIRWNVSSIPDGTTITLSFYLDSVSSDGKGNGGVLRGINLRTGNMLSEWSLAPQDETIGGRNLLTGTDVWVTVFNDYRTGGKGSETIPAGSVVTVSVEVNADNLVWDTTSSTHRIGFETSLTKTGGGSQYFGVWAGNGISEALNVVEVFTGSIHKRISKTFTLLGDFELGRSGYIYTQGVAQGTVRVGRAKIEYGNRATDWSPSEGDIVKRTQRIYYRWNSATAPAAPTSWVTKGDDGSALWTKMHVAITSTHKYIYTCEQYEMADGTLGHTDVLLDNTITVIDGGNIITGSVTANKLNASDINASKTLTVGAMTDAAAATILNSNLQVGGRNLLTGTGDWSGAYPSSGSGSASGDTFTFSAHTSLGWYSVSLSHPHMPFSDVDGQTLTLSFDYRSDDFSDTSGDHRIWINAAASATESGSRTKYREISTSAFDGVFVPTTEWQRGSITFDLSEALLTAGSGECNYFYIQFYNHTLNSLQLRHVKLERGNTATDWSPAPEDVDAAVSDAAKTATSYITQVDQNGITIHPSGGTSNRVEIDADGMEVYKGNVSVASYGDTARIGKEAGPRVVVESYKLSMYAGSTGETKIAEMKEASIGDDVVGLISTDVIVADRIGNEGGPQMTPTALYVPDGSEAYISTMTLGASGYRHKISGFNFGYAASVTNQNGIVTFNPGMGVKPTAVFVTHALAPNETNNVAKLAVPFVWAIDSATQVQVRWKRTDSNDYLRNNTVGYYWLAIY